MSKDDYWTRKEQRDIEREQREIANKPRIERQSARRDAIEFHRLECTYSEIKPSLDRVKEIMGILEGWLGEETNW